MIQHAYSPVEHSKQVKDSAQQLNISLGQDPKHAGYEQLLKQNAMDYDSNLLVQPPRATSRLHEHDIGYSYPPGAKEALHIESSIETTLANKTMNSCKPSNQNSLISKEACLKLLPLPRSVWEKIESVSKAMKLYAHEHEVDRLSSKSPCKDFKSPNKFSLTQLSELL